MKVDPVMAMIAKETLLSSADRIDRLEAINARLIAHLKAILAANDEFRASLPNDWEGDPLHDECVKARATIEGMEVSR